MNISEFFFYIFGVYAHTLVYCDTPFSNCTGDGNFTVVSKLNHVSSGWIQITCFESRTNFETTKGNIFCHEHTGARLEVVILQIPYFVRGSYTPHKCLSHSSFYLRTHSFSSSSSSAYLLPCFSLINSLQHF